MVLRVRYSLKDWRLCRFKCNIDASFTNQFNRVEIRIYDNGNFVFVKTKWFSPLSLVDCSTTIFKMVSEPLQDPLGHLLSGFRYRATHHLCPETNTNSVVCEGVC
ncbi:hypothetical protein MTR_5g038930 [Medicago truncatula]|uniref:Uncharacterized protein n=1 Tax=Medicago truncatula TaxID=3880 RepID=G7KB54_MEDTR|nr:hypothetical protein MTR_5g038930 [Medicago truncatula]